MPSAQGARRRRTSVALADPRVRVRTGGKIYARRIEFVEGRVIVTAVDEAVEIRRFHRAA